MNTKTILVIATVTSLLLAGCQAGQPPERPLNTGDRPRVGEPVVAPEDEVLPTLNITEESEEREMKLRSQTSRFLDDNKQVLEITLSSSRLAFCENESPELLEGEEQIIITLKGKTPIIDGKAIDAGYELSAKYKSQTDEKEFAQENFTEMSISDINAAIVRGKMDINLEEFSIEGEFFTAICK